MANYSTLNAYNVCDACTVKPSRGLGPRYFKKIGTGYFFDDFVIVIKNLRDLPKDKRGSLEPTQFRVDRSSPLGNPFHMPRLPDGSLNEEARDSVINNYHRYFDKMVKAFKKDGYGINSLDDVTVQVLVDFSREYSKSCTPKQLGYKFIGFLRAIFKTLALEGKIELWDWCAPKRCHADIIASFLVDHAALLREYREKHLESKSERSLKEQIDLIKDFFKEHGLDDYLYSSSSTFTVSHPFYGGVQVAYETTDEEDFCRPSDLEE